MIEETPARPSCGVCGTKLICHDCDDLRPIADDLYRGWRLLSPFDRWETVDRVDYSGVGRVRVWTKESGKRPWIYWKNTKVTAHSAEQVLNGKPEIRVTEYDWADGPIYAVACLDTDRRQAVASPGVLAQATYVGRGKGWNVTHIPTEPDAAGTDGQTVTNVPTKARARTHLVRVARQLAAEYGVPLSVTAKESY